MKHLSLSNKLFLLLAVPLVAMVIIALIGRIYIGQMAQSGQQLYENDLLSIQYLGQIRTDNRAIDGYVLELMLSTDGSRNGTLEENITERQEQIIKNLESFLASYEPKTEAVAQQVQLVEEEVRGYVEAVSPVLQPALRNENAAAYRLYLSDLRPERQQLVESAAALMEQIQREAQQANEQIQDDRLQAIIIFWVVAATSFFTAIGLGVYIALSIIRPVKQLDGLMRQAGEGDLTVHGTYEARDEIGSLVQSFNAMKESLRTLIQQISVTSDRVAVSSDDLKSNVEETTKATEMVAVTMEEIASGSSRQLTRVKSSNETLTELTDGIQHVSTNAHHMTTLSEESLEKVAAGTALIEQLEQRLAETNTQVKDLQRVVTQLDKRSQEIDSITGTISAIAEQTNLLALNAAIEAARAGEQGRGFAVVASEVRKLAEESATATKRISMLITDTQTETREAVETMNVVDRDVTYSVAHVHETGVAFNNIQQAIEQVAQKVEEVSGAVQEMAAGATEMLTAVHEIQGITATTATDTENVSAATEEQMASMQEITASAQELSNMADELRDVTKRFHVE